MGPIIKTTTLTKDEIQELFRQAFIKKNPDIKDTHFSMQFIFDAYAQTIALASAKHL